MLALPKLEASVTVAQDKQEAAADRAQSFGTVLTRDEIEALSDDPATLQQQLQDMAGPGAVIRIDGFEGGALPAKAQIRSIRISRDQFAAEYHTAGGVFIEIITQPGLGPIRYNSTIRLRGDSLSGRSPFVPVKGPEQNALYGLGFGGALLKEKSSFYLSVYGINSYETPNLNVALPSGTQSLALGPQDAARQSLRERASGLRAHARSDAPVRVQPDAAHDRQSRRRWLRRSRSAPTARIATCNNLRVQHFGPDRPARVLAVAAAALLVRRQYPVGDRGAAPFA